MLIPDVALDDTRWWLVEFAPGAYRPEMTDEQVRDVVLEIARTWPRQFDFLVGHLDITVPDWRVEGARPSRSLA
jgi:hypothetical protein